MPCYTEGEESLKKTIDSLATLTYDDKRKLLMIICDGMIIGSGNDRPTPRIVLDIFGVDQTVDPDPLMFKSVGEGSKQLNYGKVWSGLYEVDGRACILLSRPMLTLPQTSCLTSLSPSAVVPPSARSPATAENETRRSWRCASSTECTLTARCTRSSSRCTTRSRT